MQVPKLTNMTSPRSGVAVANQYIIETDDGEVFQSYRTPIAQKHAGRKYTKYTISSNYNYSVTTEKYFTQWLRSFGFNDVEIKALKRWLSSAKYGSELVELVAMPVSITYVEEL